MSRELARTSARKARVAFLLRALAGASVVAGAVLVVFWRGSELLLGWPGGDGSDVLVLSRPEWLGLLALVPALLALAPARAEAGHARGAAAAGLALRAASLTCLVLALCRPERQGLRAEPGLVVAVDVSASVSDAQLAEARALVGSIRRAARPQAVPLLTFARSAARVETEEAIRRPSEPGSGEESDLQAALRAAYPLFTPDRLPRVLLISDGAQTQGDLIGEVGDASRLGVQIDYHLPIDRAPAADASVERLILPDEIALGVPFKLRARLHASAPLGATATLFQEGRPEPIETRELSLAAGDHELELPATVSEPGRVEYRLELRTHAPEHFAENNRASAATVVSGPARVLLIDPEPAQLLAAATALRERDFEVEVRAPSGMPHDTAQLARYDFVVVSDVPASELRATGMAAIREYVEELGGGFMLAGGPNGFGAGGYEQSPLAALLPVGMAGEALSEEPSLALALIIDCSGSMAGQKLELARQAASLTADALGDWDLIEVIGFTSEPERRVRLQRAGNRASIAQSIAQLAASGGTQLYPALDAAHRDLRGARVRIKHAILLTDGQTQESGVEELAIAMRADGITLSTVGLGGEINRELLETLAGLGGGRAYVSEDGRNVPQIFVSEATQRKQSSLAARPTRVHVAEPAGFLEGIAIDLAPPLGGYVATQPKPRPAQVILRSDSGEPLLARWRVGLGQTLAWTSDLKPRWSSDWLRWPSFARFFAQLVREHMRASRAEEIALDVQPTEIGARVSADVNVDVEGSRDRPGGTLASTLRVTDRAGTTRTIALVQIAPGRYQADLPLRASGAYTLESSHRAGGHEVARGRGRFARPYPAEYAPGVAGAPLLARAASLTGGRRIDGVADALARPSTAAGAGPRRPLWTILVWLAFGLFLAHEGVRRTPVFAKTPGPGRDGG